MINISIVSSRLLIFVFIFCSLHTLSDRHCAGPYELQCLLSRFTFPLNKLTSSVKDIRNIPVNVLGKVYNAAQATVQLSFK